MNAKTGFIVIMCMTAITIVGCASMNRDLEKEGSATVKTMPVDNVTYLYTNIWQDGVKLIVSGTVALESPEIVRNEPSHMDITVRDSGGEELMIAHTPYRKHHHAGKGNQVRFNTSARLLVPEKSVVVFQHHFAKVSVHDLM